MIDVADRIDQLLALDPNAPAVEAGNIWHSWRDLRMIMDGIESALHHAGLNEGAPVGILLRNRPAILAAALGIIRTKRCIVTINPLLPAEPLQEDILALRAPALIADPEDWENPTFAAAAKSIGALGLGVYFDAQGKAQVDQITAPGDRNAHAFRDDMPGIAIEMLTSGTTGKPKRVRLGRDGLSRSLWTGAQYETPDPSKLDLKATTVIHCAPLVHISGMWGALYALYNGRRLTLMETFDPQVWRDLVVRYRPKLGNLPPSALRMIHDRDFPKEDLASLLAVRTGAAKLDWDLADAFIERYGIPVLDTYGATEFAGGVAGWTIKDFKAFYPAKRGSVGRKNAGVDIRVVDRATFAILPTNQEGLLEVRSAQIGSGQDWVRTTDLARLDDDGFLFILGRADAVIIRGGFKIAPEAVEAALKSHPAVREACVVGIADKRLGEVPVAAVQLHAGERWPEEGAFSTFLRQKLKPYEIPVAFRQIDDMPRTPSMKISQPAVRALFSH